MRRCATIEEYFAQPVGRYFVGRAFVHYFLRPRLDGLMVFDRLAVGDAAQLVRAFDLQLSHAAEASILDARRVEGIDADAFTLLVGMVQQHWRRPISFASRVAVLRPTRGLASAVAAGFLEVAPPRGAWRVFTELRDAVAWVAAPDEEEALLADLAELDHVAEAPAVIRALRAWLVAHPAGATLAGAARALASSTRSLQRKLAAAGTTFRAEHQAAQVKAAIALIEGTDAKLTTIAHEVGCSSLQHFSTLFSRLTGEAPSAYRRNRG